MTEARIERRSLLGTAGLVLATPFQTLAAPRKPRVAIKTARGVIVVELEAQKAPLTCANFLRYVDAGKYDDGAFFRATRTPRALGEGTIVGRPALRSHPYPPIAHESTTMTGLRHVAGTISLGRFAPGTATSNFFICASPEPYLDAQPDAKGDNLGFAAFGHVVQGVAVVRRILSLPTGGKSPFDDQRGQWLTTPVTIVTMRQAA